MQRQEKYGNELGVPWGMSESEYNVRDIEQTYQYSSFGVPDIGYKRGLVENTVIAPYASGLAAMVDPAAAARRAAAEARHVRGVAIWRLGLEDPAIWARAIPAAALGPPPAAPRPPCVMLPH